MTGERTGFGVRPVEVTTAPHDSQDFNDSQLVERDRYKSINAADCPLCPVYVRRNPPNGTPYALIRGAEQSAAKKLSSRSSDDCRRSRSSASGWPGTGAPAGCAQTLAHQHRGLTVLRAGDHALFVHIWPMIRLPQPTATPERAEGAGIRRRPPSSSGRQVVRDLAGAGTPPGGVGRHAWATLYSSTTL